MTVNPYKIEYQNLLKDRDESLKVLEEGVDSETYIELKKEVYVLNSIVARMESFLREEP